MLRYNTVYIFNLRERLKEREKKKYRERETERERRRRKERQRETEREIKIERMGGELFFTPSDYLQSKVRHKAFFCTKTNIRFHLIRKQLSWLDRKNKYTYFNNTSVFINAC